MCEATNAGCIHDVCVCLCVRDAVRYGRVASKLAIESEYPVSPLLNAELVKQLFDPNN